MSELTRFIAVLIQWFVAMFVCFMNFAFPYFKNEQSKCFCILSAGLGFNIRGGSDAPYLPNNPGIFVTSVRPGGVADRDRRLKRGDRILEVN